MRNSQASATLFCYLIPANLIWISETNKQWLHKKTKTSYDSSQQCCVVLMLYTLFTTYMRLFNKIIILLYIFLTLQWKCNKRDKTTNLTVQFNYLLGKFMVPHQLVFCCKKKHVQWTWKHHESSVIWKDDNVFVSF